MNYKHLFWVIPLLLIIGLIIGLLAQTTVQNAIMSKYDLYNCVYNNAYLNDFNQNPSMIEKIQNECLCFRYYNYTDLLDKDCSNFVFKNRGGLAE